MPLPLLGALGIQAGSSLLGGLFGSRSSRPPPRNLRREIGGVTDVLPDVAGAAYGASADYLPQYTALETARDSAVRGSTVGDVGQLAGDVAGVRRAYAPETRALLDDLLARARSGLAGNGALSAEDTRLAQQDARSAWAARGLGRSGAAAAGEILNTEALRRQRRDEAQQMGLRTAGTVAAIEGDPFGTILGMPVQGYGEAAYANASPLPLLGYSSDLYNTNYNAAASAANASANNRAGLWGAGIGGLGQILGGYYGGQGG